MVSHSAPLLETDAGAGLTLSKSTSPELTQGGRGTSVAETRRPDQRVVLASVQTLQGSLEMPLPCLLGKLSPKSCVPEFSHRASCCFFSFFPNEDERQRSLISQQPAPALFCMCPQKTVCVHVSSWGCENAGCRAWVWCRFKLMFLEAMLNTRV